MRHFMVAGVLVAGLSGCGGGSDVGGFTADLNALGALADDLTAKGWDVTTPVAQIPTSGTPTYHGQLLAGDSVTGGLYTGDLTMQADFAASTVGGNVSNIYDVGERAVSGSLVIGSTTIDRTADPLLNEPQFASTITGSLLDVDGVSFSVSGTVDGEFGGPNAEALGFLVTGTSTSSVYGVELFDGVGLASQ